MSKREINYEKEDVQVILEKPFSIVDGDYAEEIVCSENPPFPWEDEVVGKLNVSLPNWKMNNDVKHLFDKDGGYETYLNLRVLDQYMKDNAEKFKKWLLECDDVIICYHADDNQSDFVYIRGTRKETDEEFNTRIAKIEKRRAKQAASLEKAKQKRALKKEEEEKALFEKLKQKYESKS